MFREYCLEFGEVKPKNVVENCILGSGLMAQILGRRNLGDANKETNSLQEELFADPQEFVLMAFPLLLRIKFDHLVSTLIILQIGHALFGLTHDPLKLSCIHLGISTIP